MKNIKNIIFDYGNVIFNIDFKKVQQAFRDLGVQNVEDFYGHRKQDEVFDLLDRGEISNAGFRDRLRELTNKPELTDQQIDDAWNSIFLDTPAEYVDVLKKLKGRYRTFLLSNTNAIHEIFFNDYNKRTFGHDSNDELFEKVYYSHIVGKRKPEAAIFEQVLTENSLKPQETLFIDDSPQHLETARVLGMHTFLMTAPDNIVKFLERENLI
ncbi:MAG: HAD family hydrolase [Mucilaginibacter sp.]